MPTQSEWAVTNEVPEHATSATVRAAAITAIVEQAPPMSGVWLLTLDVEGADPAVVWTTTQAWMQQHSAAEGGYLVFTGGMGGQEVTYMSEDAFEDAYELVVE